MITFLGNDVDQLIKLTRSIKVRLLLDLDLQLRFGTQWDPTNAVRLLKYIKSQGYGENVDFELGNGKQTHNCVNLVFIDLICTVLFTEPGCFKPETQQLKIAPEQVGRDYVSFVKVIRQFKNLSGSRIVGPDNVLTTPGSDGLNIMQQ